MAVKMKDRAVYERKEGEVGNRFLESFLGKPFKAGQRWQMTLADSDNDGQSLVLRRAGRRVRERAGPAREQRVWVQKAPWDHVQEPRDGPGRPEPARSWVPGTGGQPEPRGDVTVRELVRACSGLRMCGGWSRGSLDAPRRLESVRAAHGVAAERRNAEGRMRDNPETSPAGPGLTLRAAGREKGCDREDRGRSRQGPNRGGYTYPGQEEQRAWSLGVQSSGWREEGPLTAQKRRRGPGRQGRRSGHLPGRDARRLWPVEVFHSSGFL